MSYGRLIAISMVVAAIFLMPLFAFAEDETPPGLPFERLQNQINDLQQQIEAIQEVPIIKGYRADSWHSGTLAQSENVRTEIAAIELPAGGQFLMSIELGVAFRQPNSPDYECTTFLDCACFDENGIVAPGFGVAEGISNVEHVTNSFILTLEGDPNTRTKLTLQCKHYCGYCPPAQPLQMMGGTWIAIELDEVETQVYPYVFE